MALVIDLRDGSDPVSDLTRRLVETVGREDAAERDFGMYFLHPESEFAPLARFVERQVFDQHFGNDAKTMDEEYDPFEDASTFILAVDHRTMEPAGMLRRVAPNPLGLKTLHDLETAEGWGVTPEQIAAAHPGFVTEEAHELATIAVADQWRKGPDGMWVSAAIFHMCWRVDVAQGNDFVVAAVDEEVTTSIVVAEIPYFIICGLPAITYMGSPATIPVLLDIAETTRVIPTMNSIGRMLALGEGLEDRFSMPPLDLRDGDRDPRTLEPQGDLIGTGVVSNPAAVTNPAARPSPLRAT